MTKKILKSLSIFALTFVSTAYAQNSCVYTTQQAGYTTKVNVIEQPKSGDLVYFDKEATFSGVKSALFSINPNTGLRTKLVSVEFLNLSFPTAPAAGITQINWPSKMLFVEFDRELYRINFANLGLTTATIISKPCVTNTNFTLSGLTASNANNKVYYSYRLYNTVTREEKNQFFESDLSGSNRRLIFETSRRLEQFFSNNIAFDSVRNSIIYNTYSGTQSVLVRTNIDNPLVSEEIYKTSTHYLYGLSYNNNNDTINFVISPRLIAPPYIERSNVIEINSRTLKAQAVGLGAYENNILNSPREYISAVLYDGVKKSAYFINQIYNRPIPLLISTFETITGLRKPTTNETFSNFTKYFALVPYPHDTQLKSFSHTNRVDAFDVDGDGRVVSSDALEIINALKLNGSNVINLTPKTQATNLHLDVNRDNKVTASDALAVINEISRRTKI